MNTPDTIHFTKEANDKRSEAYADALRVEMLDALDRLIASVEAGEVRTYVIEEIAALDFDWDVWRKFGPAYSGSLDAALYLKDALLPGWLFGVRSGETGFVSWCISPDYRVSNMTSGGEETFEVEAGYGCWVTLETPARALLLATLKAYRHTVAEGQG